MLRKFAVAVGCSMKPLFQGAPSVKWLLLQLLRWGLVLFFLWLGLYLGFAACANWWAAVVPPHEPGSDYYHRTRGNAMAIMALAFLASAPCAAWLFRPRRGQNLLLWVLIGSGVSFLTGGAVGLFIANMYERFYYEPEPDPLHFDVAFVWLGAWTVICILGSAAFVYLAWRRKRAKEVSPTFCAASRL
jgi:hypothetical protein